MRAAQLRLDVAAHNVANAQTPGFQRSQVRQQAQLPSGVLAQVERLPAPGADLVQDVVQQRAAAADFGANLLALRMALKTDQTLGALLDTRA
ncbi:flagellar basal body protein [Serpentinimonas raichei]|jgi:flagellar basal-body rod protein FlgC|uniref:Flagellar basal body protein n=2 Tax=Serpentinimonas raichei TaxID=1458425 RepID=A0A060NSW0_9BURK|nr:flagellar basal body protein [Serpentinimonas sp.]BAO81989.1 flagellar basal body protein [Serpentinimonas raichei]